MLFGINKNNKVFLTLNYFLSSAKEYMRYFSLFFKSLKFTEDNNFFGESGTETKINPF